MRELYSILDVWAPGAVLATVVDVKGSAYRKPGARMLILPDGRRIGSISGGCLEGEVARKAWWWTESNRTVVRVFDTTSDDDAVRELGLGCNGVVRVLLERLDRERSGAMFAFLSRLRQTRSTGVLATRLDNGERAFFDHRGRAVGGSPVDETVTARALDVLRTRRSKLAGGVFCECIAPPPQLLIFGAGLDAAPLVRLAHELGWHVTVADGRPSYARPERFPQADAVVLTRPDDLLAGVPIEPEALAVVMNHSYAVDRAILGALLERDLPYVGMLGPRVRTERMLAQLGVGRVPDSLHAPVGLDLGGDTPESIALSILAEMQASLKGREGGMLRERTMPIYSEAVPA